MVNLSLGKPSFYSFYTWSPLFETKIIPAKIVKHLVHNLTLRKKSQQNFFPSKYIDGVKQFRNFVFCQDFSP